MTLSWHIADNGNGEMPIKCVKISWHLIAITGKALKHWQQLHLGLKKKDRFPGAGMFLFLFVFPFFFSDCFLSLFPLMFLFFSCSCSCSCDCSCSSYCSCSYGDLAFLSLLANAINCCLRLLLLLLLLIFVSLPVLAVFTADMFVDDVVNIVDVWHNLLLEQRWFHVRWGQL